MSKSLQNIANSKVVIYTSVVVDLKNSNCTLIFHLFVCNNYNTSFYETLIFPMKI